ncbi:hypothetical protein LSPH26S_03809 [Lysinibacillus sphaericus]
MNNASRSSTSSASPRDGSWHRCQPSSPSGIALPSRPQSDSASLPDMPERRSLMKRRQGAMHLAQSNNACTKRLSDRPSLLHTTGVAPSPAYPNRCCSTPRTSSATDMRHWANPSSRTACHFRNFTTPPRPSHRHRPAADRMHVSGRLMQQTDGPMLEALKQLHHQSIRLPSRPQDQPDRDRLATRFAEFRAVS